MTTPSLRAELEAARLEVANLTRRAEAAEKRAHRLEKTNNRMGQRVMRKHVAMEDARDMAAVGESLMRAIDVYTREEGPLKDWTPAEDPAEIVGDLYSMLEEAHSHLSTIRKEALEDAAKVADSAPRGAYKEQSGQCHEAIAAAIRALSDKEQADG